MQLEFHYLSVVSGQPKFGQAATRASEALRTLPVPGAKHGEPAPIKPIDVHPNLQKFNSQRRSIGASGDSYYEYILKLWLLRRRSALDVSGPPGEAWLEEQALLAEYKDVVQAIEAEMVGRVRLASAAANNLQVRGLSQPVQLAWVGAKNSAKATLESRMEHLTCFVPGMLALGVLSREAELAHHLGLAQELMATCMAMYASTATGLAAEAYEVDSDGLTLKNNAGLLRPETVESLFLLWRATGDAQYREWGWKIFMAVEEHAKLALEAGGGYTAVEDVEVQPVERSDRMDSFFLSETLKYLWLLFSPDHNLPLHRFVLNTEGHPFPSGGQ